MTVYRLTAVATSLIAEQVKSALEAEGSKLSQVLDDTSTTIPEAISGIEVTIDETALAAIIIESISDSLGDIVIDETAIASAIATKFRGSISIVSPVVDNQDIDIVSGDDYNITDTRELSWTNTSGNWCGGDLTSAIVEIFFVLADSTALFKKTGEVVTATGAQKVCVQLTSAETSLFTKAGSSYKYQLRFTKSDRTEMRIAGDVKVTLPYLVTS